MAYSKLILGNCLKRMAELEAESVDLTVTSPPYDNLRTYNGNNEQWGEHVWKAVIADLFRVTKQGGVVVWVVGDATINGSETGTSFRQALWAMDCGFRLHDTMIWNKGCFSAVGALQVRYAPVFEYMFVLSKESICKFNPIKDRKTKHGGKITSGTVRQSDGTTKPFSKSGTVSFFSQRFNIWEQSPQRQVGGHPAPFPLQLANDHIISWSNEGDTVLDCFMGSGTTGVACVKTGRSFIGIELDKGYFELANARIAHAKKSRGLLNSMEVW